jgi:hypothetical protein
MGCTVHNEKKDKKSDREYIIVLIYPLVHSTLDGECIMYTKLAIDILLYIETS